MERQKSYNRRYNAPSVERQKSYNRRYNAPSVERQKSYNRRYYRSLALQNCYMYDVVMLKRPLNLFMAENNSESVDVDPPPPTPTQAHLERLLAYR